MHQRHRFCLQGLALLGACGLLLVGAGCCSERGVDPEVISDSWSLLVTTSALPPTPTNTSIDVKRFFLESRGILDREPVSRSCPTNSVAEPVLFIGHYPPASTRFRETVATWHVCAQRAIRHVVIVSPDHYQRLESGFATTHQSYQMNAREFTVHAPTIDRLRAIGAVSSTLFANEHGVGVPLAIVSTELRYIELVTAIVLSRRVSEAQARALASELRHLQEDPHTLIVVSVDFSHGLTRDRASVMDEETKRALATRDRAFFWRAQDVHTDFGRGLALMLDLLPEQGSVYIDQSFDGHDLGGTDPLVTSFMSGWLVRD